MFIHLKNTGAVILTSDSGETSLLGNVNKSTAHRIIVMNLRLDPRDAGDIVLRLERATRKQREVVIDIPNVSTSTYNPGKGHTQTRCPFNSSGSGTNKRGIRREVTNLYTADNQSRSFVSR